MAAELALIVALSTAAGWGDRPSLIAAGGDPARGVLINLTPGSGPADGPDPARPSVVFVHGFNPVPRAVHFQMAELFAASVARRGGPAFNVFGWDWNGATFVGLRADANTRAAVGQGRALAFALKGAGLAPSRTHLVGHSSGAIVAASAARSLASEFGDPVAHLTLLDPAAYYHETIFGELAAGTSAPVVENFWAPGPSGYGRAVAAAGVANTRVDGPTPYFGAVWPLRSSHFFVVHWYNDSAADPSYPSGFNTSVLLRPRAPAVAAGSARAAGR